MTPLPGETLPGRLGKREEVQEAHLPTGLMRVDGMRLLAKGAWVVWVVDGASAFAGEEDAVALIGGRDATDISGAGTLAEAFPVAEEEGCCFS